ncbi:hypothetical protein [Aeromonas hydrophila]|uniref:hypothetical protein n=1 Tax=Aeromonas hydrophila TaxID=644 RepID=UPI002B46A2F3|nr:hypothetical protein [Aeromonas hydrophila]
MKALMSITFMSAGSLLDISSDTKQDLYKVQRKLRNQSKLHLTVQAAAREAALNAICHPYPSTSDRDNLQNDWVVIGQDIQKSLEKYSVETTFIGPQQCEGYACAEHSR